ncbi:MAG: hypothetical protein CL609_16120 [Anaerolineaceae bacterium]|nr:hypothetical protein [Anaerolineaceae bacterium]
MNPKPRSKTFLFYLVFMILLLGSLACSLSTFFLPQIDKSSQRQVEVGPSTAREPAATFTPAPPPVGSSRSYPFPRTAVNSVPNWDVQIMDVKRGEEAWLDIQAANMFNKSAPEGMEYLLVKIHVKSTAADQDEHPINGCDFDVTGDNRINYTCGMASVVEPDPFLDAVLFTGGETEGWAAYLVNQGEGNLILVVNDRYNYDLENIRFIAIDEGASIDVPPDLVNIQPSETGKDRSAPAGRNETIITEDWGLSIVEVIRGEEAWNMTLAENQFNDPPQDGFEYIAVKIHVRNISPEDRFSYMDGSFFKSTGDAGVLYDSPVVVDPSPQLDITLYPGGEYTGWVVVQAAVGESNLLLVFQPLFDFTGDEKRFISLEP